MSTTTEPNVIRLDVLRDLWARFEEDCLTAEGEVTPELAQQHEALQLATPDAIDAFCLYVRSLEHQQTGLRAWEQELAAKREQIGRRVEALKKIAFDLVEARGELSPKGSSRTLRGGLYNLATQANGGVEPLEILLPVEQLPEEFVVMKPEPNVLAIRSAVAAGMCEPDVARILPRGRHLRLR